MKPDSCGEDQNGLEYNLEYNQRAWNELAEAGDIWFHAASPEQIAAARGGAFKIRVTPQKGIPHEWLGDLKSKKVLCLAGGGGQQGPILAAAGANVTVLDISPKQLERDLEVAQRNNLKLETLVADMVDLGAINDQTFDLIVNPCSVCYVPDVRPIWKEAYRVLKEGGELISGLINPVYYLFDAIKMDAGRLVARHKIPYSDFDLPPDERDRIMGDSRPLEFGHSLQDLIGGQMQAGFHVIDMFEDGWGDNDKLSSLIPTFMAIRARKPSPTRYDL